MVHIGVTGAGWGDWDCRCTVESILQVGHCTHPLSARTHHGVIAYAALHQQHGYRKPHKGHKLESVDAYCYCPSSGCANPR